MHWRRPAGIPLRPLARFDFLSLPHSVPSPAGFVKNPNRSISPRFSQKNRLPVREGGFS